LFEIWKSQESPWRGFFFRVFDMGDGLLNRRPENVRNSALGRYPRVSRPRQASSAVQA